MPVDDSKLEPRRTMPAANRETLAWLTPVVWHRVRSAAAVVAVGMAFLLSSSALATTTASVLAGKTVSGAAIPCNAQSDGIRVCHGTYTSGEDLRVKTFDGVPLEVYVILPPAPASGTDGSYPLVIQSHGWPEPGSGGQARGLGDTDGGPSAQAWASHGYAVLQLTARGFGMSCGKAAQQAEPPTDFMPGGICANGYVRLDDDRYEARDPQYAAGLLVDEGIVDPARIGAVGASYGGGVTFELGTLKDRIMNPDGTLSPWRTPNGTPISLAAAAPVIPWSDLAYSLVPNGRTLDYEITSSTADLSPIGVMKQSFVSGLFGLGESAGYFATPGLNPEADLTSWFATVSAGEPYDQGQMPYVIDQLARYHSPYYLLDGRYGTATEPPPPLLIASGFTDDLFPVDEALRYYNLETKLYPTSPVALFDWDGGHQRGQNKPADNGKLSDDIAAFFDHYVKGTGTQAPLGVTAFTQTCPSTAASGGPLTAPTWAGLHPGEVDYGSRPGQSISSSAGDPTISQAVDPIVGGGACATVSGTDQGSGVATYRLPAASGSGYTLLGSPTVIANLTVSGQFPYIAARLWDVDPQTNTQTLVARGVYRIDQNHPNGLQVFQLHSGAWHFASGHIPKLELLGRDAPYVRASNGQFTITVRNLRLRLPVHEAPGSAPGVTPPSADVFPGSPVCIAGPVVRIERRGTRASHRGLVLRGTAAEQRCAGATRANRAGQRVVKVLVAIWRTAGHGHCRFLTERGHLGRAQRCARLVWLRAHGTTHWTLRLNTRIPSGRLVILADAVDDLGHHAVRARASVSAR